ncbi:MAG: hypothetical protein PVJ27_00685, partial [Candidatus Brocadiaceae bacterium]
ARIPLELGSEADPAELEQLERRGLLIEQWDIDRIGLDEAECGASGSPTRVKQVDSVKLLSEEHKRVEPTNEGLAQLVEELSEEHIFD